MFSENYDDVSGAPSMMDSLSGVFETVKDAGSSVASYFKSDSGTEERKFHSSSSMQGFGSNGFGNSSGGFQNSSYHSDNKGGFNSSSQSSWRQDSWRSESSFTRTRSKKKKKNKEVTLDNFFDDTDESDSEPKRKKKKNQKKKSKKTVKKKVVMDSDDESSSEPPAKSTKKRKQKRKQKGKKTPKPKAKGRKKKKPKTPEPSESESDDESSFEFEKVEVKKPKKSVKKNNKSKTKSKLPKKAKKQASSGSEDEDASDSDDLEAHFESKKDTKKKKKGAKTKAIKDEDVPNLLDLTPKPKTTESLLDNIVNPTAAPNQPADDIFSYRKTSNDNLLAPQPLHSDLLASANSSPFDALMNQQQRPQPNILGLGPSTSPMMGPATFIQPMPGFGASPQQFPGSRQTRSNSGNFQGNVQMQRGRSNSGQGYRGQMPMGTFGSPAGARGYGYPAAPMYGGYAANQGVAFGTPGAAAVPAGPSFNTLGTSAHTGGNQSPFVSIKKEKKKTKHMSFAARMDAANFSLGADGGLQTTMI